MNLPNQSPINHQSNLPSPPKRVNLINTAKSLQNYPINTISGIKPQCVKFLLALLILFHGQPRFPWLSFNYNPTDHISMLLLINLAAERWLCSVAGESTSLRCPQIASDLWDAVDWIECNPDINISCLLNYVCKEMCSLMW